MTKKNLLVYDNIEVAGGAELVTKVLLQQVGFDTLLVNSIDKTAVEKLELDTENIVTLTRQPLSKKLSILSTAYNFWRYRDKQQYDTVLVSGIFAPLLVPNISARRFVYYCHTPPRFLYDLRDFYQKQLSTFSWGLLQAFSRFYEPRYRKALESMDLVIANSQNVQSRLKKYLDVDSTVIYPPCFTEYKNKESKGYYLSTARLEPYKRVDKIIDTFVKLPDKQLVIMSGGSMLEQLQKKAEHCSNITFTGWVNEAQKKQLIEHCEATIYIPKDEDFGMSPVESIGAGKPVIGVAEGGLLETVIHGINGFLCDPTNIEQDLRVYIKRSHELSINHNSNQIHNFTLNQFTKQISGTVKPR